RASRSRHVSRRTIGVRGRAAGRHLRSRPQRGQRSSPRPIPGRRAAFSRHSARLPRRARASCLQRPAGPGRIGRPRSLGATGGNSLDSQQTPERPRSVSSTPAQEPSRTWTFLLLGLAFVAGFYYLAVTYGSHLPWQISKAAIGLGLVIFLHELGHFAVAKGCDGHVEVFSLGFGHAIPGLSFRKGETLYKIAWVPLGGYVKMLGEGSENEEDDDNPRSFKNKTVGQRMAIISAGVVMNVVLGAICFILAFHGGIKQDPAVIDLIEPASPAWNHGVRTGQVIEHIGDVDR